MDDVMIKEAAFLSIAILCALRISNAVAESWETVGSDLGALGFPLRTIKIDLASIRPSATEVTVAEIVTTYSVGNVGYSCSEGELRHGNTDKAVAKLACTHPTNPNPYHDNHTPNWQTLSTTRTRDGEIKIEFDVNGIYRDNDEIMLTQITSTSSRKVATLDCRGYYKAGNGWASLDTTDHIPTVPPGFVSLERKVSSRVCAIAKR